MVVLVGLILQLLRHRRNDGRVLLPKWWILIDNETFAALVLRVHVKQINLLAANVWEDISPIWTEPDVGNGEGTEVVLDSCFAIRQMAWCEVLNTTNGKLKLIHVCWLIQEPRMSASPWFISSHRVPINGMHYNIHRISFVLQEARSCRQQSETWKIEIRCHPENVRKLCVFDRLITGHPGLLFLIRFLGLFWETTRNKIIWCTATKRSVRVTNHTYLIRNHTV